MLLLMLQLHLPRLRSTRLVAMQWLHLLGLELWRIRQGIMANSNTNPTKIVRFIQGLLSGKFLVLF